MNKLFLMAGISCSALSLSILTPKAKAQQGQLDVPGRVRRYSVRVRTKGSGTPTPDVAQNADQNKNDVNNALGDIAQDAINHLSDEGKITGDEKASLLVTDTAGTTLSLPGPTAVTTSSFQLGGTVASSASGSGGSGGGVTPAYGLSGEKYNLLFAFNTASRQTVNLGTGTGGTGTSISAGSALLNPGSQTQGINFIATYNFAGQPPSLHKRLIEGIAAALKASQGSSTDTRKQEFKILADAFGMSTASFTDADFKDMARRVYNRLLDLGRSKTGGTPAPAGDSADSAPPSTDSSPSSNMRGIAGVYLRLGFASLDFTGTDPANTAQTKTVSGNVFSPSFGLQYVFGDYTNASKIHIGVSGGFTGRLLAGDVAQGGNRAFLNQSIAHTEFWSPEATLFLTYKNVRPYVRWTQMRSGTLDGFSGSQFTIGADLFASF